MTEPAFARPLWSKQKGHELLLEMKEKQKGQEASKLIVATFCSEPASLQQAQHERTHLRESSPLSPRKPAERLYIRGQDMVAREPLSLQAQYKSGHPPPADGFLTQPSLPMRSLYLDQPPEATAKPKMGPPPALPVTAQSQLYGGLEGWLGDQDLPKEARARSSRAEARRM